MRRLYLSLPWISSEGYIYLVPLQSKTPGSDVLPGVFLNEPMTN
jgi:hypothetical protein